LLLPAAAAVVALDLDQVAGQEEAWSVPKEKLARALEALVAHSRLEV
jgi:hypothetical protein